MKHHQRHPTCRSGSAPHFAEHLHPVFLVPASSQQPCELNCATLCFILQMEKNPKPRGDSHKDRKWQRVRRTHASTFLAAGSFHEETWLGDPSHSGQLCCLPTWGSANAHWVTGPGARGIAIKPLLSVCSQPPSTGPGPLAHFIDEDQELRAEESLGRRQALLGGCSH